MEDKSLSAIKSRKLRSNEQLNKKKYIQIE